MTEHQEVIHAVAALVSSGLTPEHDTPAGRRWHKLLSLIREVVPVFPNFWKYAPHLEQRYEGHQRGLRRIGIMTGDLEQTWARRFVVKRPDGDLVDYAQLIGFLYDGLEPDDRAAIREALGLRPATRSLKPTGRSRESSAMTASE
jgi:hypothetical protein